MLCKIIQGRQEMKVQATILSEQEFENIYQKAMHTVKREIKKESSLAQKAKWQERTELYLSLIHI